LGKRRSPDITRSYNKTVILKGKRTQGKNWSGKKGKKEQKIGDNEE